MLPPIASFERLAVLTFLNRQLAFERQYEPEEAACYTVLDLPDEFLIFARVSESTVWRKAFRHRTTEEIIKLLGGESITATAV